MTKGSIHQEDRMCPQNIETKVDKMVRKNRQIHTENIKYQHILLNNQLKKLTKIHTDIKAFRKRISKLCLMGVHGVTHPTTTDYTSF